MEDFTDEELERERDRLLAALKDEYKAPVFKNDNLNL